MSSDTMVLAAYVTAALVLSATVLILLLIVVMRLRINKTNRFNEKLLQQWRPIIMQTVAGMDVKLPKLGKASALPLLHMWNHFHDILKGDSTQSLNRLAKRAGLDEIAVGMMKKGNIRNRLLAIRTFGNLRHKDVWTELKTITVSDHPVLSLAAARSLIQIDPEEAVIYIIPIIVHHPAWPPAVVSTILRQMGPDVISKPLAEAIPNAQTNEMPRVIRYLEEAHYHVIRPLVHNMLSESTNNEVISACLQVIKEPEDLAIVRNHLNHPMWFVRLQAVRTLGAIGAAQDEQKLIELLRDENWWVRYRAAKALSGLSFMKMERLKEIVKLQTDRFARDILSQVIAETQKA